MARAPPKSEYVHDKISSSGLDKGTIILDVSKPSVCHVVATLKEGGFLTMDEDSFLHLTDVGREVAERTYEKHCFFIRLLVDAGVEPKTAEQDACRMEHAISDDSFQKIKSGLQDK